MRMRKNFIKRVVECGDSCEWKTIDFGEWRSGATNPEGDNSCEDNARPELRIQEEKVRKARTGFAYSPQRIGLSGNAFQSIAMRIGVRPENLVTLNRHRVDGKILSAAEPTTVPLPEGLPLQIRSPKRWNLAILHSGRFLPKHALGILVFGHVLERR